MTYSCEHEHFEARVSVLRLQDPDGFRGRLALNVSAYCLACEAPVIFIGTVGLAANQPTVSPDYREARLPAAVPMIRNP